MRNTITRATIAGLAALSLAGSLVATSEPAAAAHFHGGFHGYHGGWHGGGWHGGGWHHGWRGGGWGGAAVLGGLAAGALLAAPYAYGYGYGPYGYGCGSYYQPMYDAYGRYIGQELVNAC